MKRNVSLLIAILLLFSCTAYADDTKELTPELIDEIGIPNVGQDGEPTILIPLDASGHLTVMVGDDTQKNSFNNHDEAIEPNHFSTLGYTHKMLNLVTRKGLARTSPLSEYADEGFTITKEFEHGVSFTMATNFTMPKKQVENAVNMSVGGTFTLGQKTTYTTPTIPKGYMGRIAYRINYDLFLFDDEITYVLNSIPIQYYTEIKKNQSAESEPYNGHFCLELKKKTE